MANANQTARKCKCCGFPMAYHSDAAPFTLDRAKMTADGMINAAASDGWLAAVCSGFVPFRRTLAVRPQGLDEVSK